MANSPENQSQPLATGRTLPLGTLSIILVLLPVVWPILALFRLTGHFPSIALLDAVLNAAVAAPAAIIITLAVPVVGILAGGFDLYLKSQKPPVSAIVAIVAIVALLAVVLIPFEGSLSSQVGLLVPVILWIVTVVLVARKLAAARHEKTVLALTGIALGPASFAVVGSFLFLINFALSWGMSFP